MASIKAEALGGLVTAAVRESEAVGALTEAVHEVREAIESLDPLRIERALAQARRRVEGLSLAANAATSLARLAARAVGVSEGTSLTEIGARMGAREGAELSAAARSLRDRLDVLAVEAAAQGVAARYGADLWSHLLGLRGESGGYCSKGQLRPVTGKLVGRV